MKWNPKPYQERALQFALDHPRAQLWLGKGLGKTSVTLHAIADLMDAAEVGRVLVVSTRRITKSVWPAEIRKWDTVSHLPIRDIEGTPKQRERLLDTPWYGIETITFEKLTWLFRVYIKARRALPWDMIVWDEASKLKAPGTHRFRALRRWQRSMPARMLNLTGSPAPAGLLNVWGPAFVLDHGERLGSTYTAYKLRWFRPDEGGWKLEPLDTTMAHVHERLADNTICLQARDYLDLPPLVVNDLWVDLPPAARVLYTKLEREMFAALRAGSVEAKNAGVLTNKCRQLANGAVYRSDDPTQWERVHEAKFEALDEVIEEAEGENVIVAYQFRFDIAELCKRWPSAAVLAGDDEQTIREWNAGKHRLLFLHPASAGHGLNLQEGGCHMVMLGAPWSFDQYDQCIDRIAGGLRRTRPTYLHRIVARDTVDDVVLLSLAGHGTVQDLLQTRMAGGDVPALQGAAVADALAMFNQ